MGRTGMSVAGLNCLSVVGRRFCATDRASSGGNGLTRNCGCLMSFTAGHMT